MNPRENYDFLSAYVPRTSEYLTVQCVKEVEGIRETIIRKHRIISLIPLLNSKFDIQQWIPDENAFPRFIFKPVEVTPPRVSPQLLQQASHLYQIIHQNPADLFNGLVSVRGTSLYYFVVNSSIPSLFGYFSSQEHIQLAFSFYMHVLTTNDTAMGTEMLFPFFNTPCVFRFIENTMSPFCERLRTETRVADKKFSDTVVDIYVNDLSKFLVSSAPLLTHCHHVILRLMLQKWGMKETSKFVIQVFIKILGCMWLEANGLLNRVPFFLAVITKIMKNESSSATIVTKIVEAETLFELPDMYNVFQHQYILLLSTCQDFIALMKVMQIRRQLPQSINCIKPETTPPFSLFWFKIFPNRQMPKHNISRPLVFSNKTAPEAKNHEFDRIWMNIKNVANELGKEPYEYLLSKKNISPELLDYTLMKSIDMLEEDAAKFEDLMVYLLNRNELNKWMEIADAHLLMSSSPIAALATCKAYERQYKYFNFAFKKASTLFSLRLTNQAQYLLLLQKYLAYYITSSIKKELAAIDKWWAAFLDKKNKELDSFIVSMTSQSSSALFWDCVEKLRIINTSDLLLSFNTIIGVVETLGELSHSLNFDGKYDKKNALIAIGELVGEAAIIGHCGGLMSAYIIIGSLGMDNHVFKELCLPQEQKAWVSLEAQIFAFLGSDMKMYERVVNVQESLRNIEKEGDDTRIY